MTGNPAIDAIIVRANAYYHECVRRNGYPPIRFRVTDQEYRFLQICESSYELDLWHSDDRQEIYLCGMLVYHPRHLVYHPGMYAMRHRSDVTLENCDTVLPTQPCHEITCPCGDVIWEYPSHDKE